MSASEAVDGMPRIWYGFFSGMPSLLMKDDGDILVQILSKASLVRAHAKKLLVDPLPRRSIVERDFDRIVALQLFALLCFEFDFGLLFLGGSGGAKTNFCLKSEK